MVVSDDGEATMMRCRLHAARTRTLEAEAVRAGSGAMHRRLARSRWRMLAAGDYSLQIDGERRSVSVIDEEPGLEAVVRLAWLSACDGTSLHHSEIHG